MGRYVHLNCCPGQGNRTGPSACPRRLSGILPPKLHESRKLRFWDGLRGKILKTGLETVRVGWLDLAILSGRLMANLLAGFAAYETEVRAERILACPTAARMRGAR